MVEQRLDSQLFCIGTCEPIVATVVMHVLIHLLCVVAVEYETVTQLVQELQGRDLDAEELTITHNCTETCHR